MKPLGKTKHHYWLAQRMAKVTGTDLAAAQRNGDLDQDQWANMVRACRKCDWSEGCERWLDSHDQSDMVPEACPNCGKLTVLHQTQSEED